MTRRAVVVGAGITGTLVSRELLLDGWEVTLLEAQHVGAGSSSRTAAGIRQQFSTPSTVIGMRHAVRRYRELADEFGAPLIRQAGYLFLSHDADADARRVAVQRAAGLADVEQLLPDDAATRFPWLDPSSFASATFCPTDGFLYPATIYNEAARRVRELGGAVLLRCPVTGAEHAGGRLSAVLTPRGRYEADLFVDATNAWTDQLGRVLGAAPLPVSPIRRYLWFLQRDDAAMPAAALAAMPLVVLPDGVYCRPENSDTLLVGWAHDAAAEPDMTWDAQDRIDPGFGHDGDVDTWPMRAWMSLAAHLPPLAAFAGLRATTSGFYGVTPDHNPFLSFDPALPNLLRLVGFSGHGAMFGPFTAAVARGLAEAGHNAPQITLPEGDVNLRAFAIDRAFDAHETQVI